MPDVPIYTGQQVPQSGQGDTNTIAFVVKQLLSRVGTSTVVKVVAVTNAGDVSPVGYVDVVPQVNQTDGAGKAVPHGTIHGLPYSRLQGGTNAVIMDPQVGDLGIAVFASRDISSVKANKGRANPGSYRRFDMADGMYCGAILNGTPIQFFQFNADGITVKSPLKVTIVAPDIVLTGNVAATGTFTSNGHDISSTHRHTGVSTGGGISGAPV